MGTMSTVGSYRETVGKTTTHGRGCPDSLDEFLQGSANNRVRKHISLQKVILAQIMHRCTYAVWSFREINPCTILLRAFILCSSF